MYMLSFDSPQALDAVFAALGDARRRDMVARLSAGEMPLSALSAPYGMSQTAATRHVRVLSDAGIVRVEKRGRTRFCRLTAAGLKDAAEWIEAYRGFWDDQLSALAAHLSEEPE